MAATTTRKLEETSWLAQTIKDKMEIEFANRGVSGRWLCLQILKIIVNEADKPDNDQIYYEYGQKKRIVICDIPSLAMEHGTDFDTTGMQNKLRGLAERYKDDDGQYLVSVLTTHDLNSATINDLSELMFQMGQDA